MENNFLSLDVKKKLPDGLTRAEAGEIVHKCVGYLKSAEREIEINWLRLGAVWHFLRINKLWSAYGEHIKNASDFLREIDLGVTRRSLEYYASIVDSKLGDYVIDNKLLIPVAKLRVIAHIVKETGDIEGWIDKCVLPQKELENSVREAKGLVTPENCEHPADKQTHYIHCEKCQKWFKQ